VAHGLEKPYLTAPRCDGSTTGNANVQRKAACRTRSEFRTPLGVGKSAVPEPAGREQWSMGVWTLGGSGRWQALWICGRICERTVCFSDGDVVAQMRTARFWQAWFRFYAGATRPPAFPGAWWLSALRFLFTVTLKRRDLSRALVITRIVPRLPEVLSVEEAARLLQAAPGIKYKAALGVAYGAGLRGGRPPQGR